MSTTVVQKLISGAVAGPVPFSGTPSAGTTEVQTITIGGTPSASSTSGFYLTFGGFRTALILWSATNATLVANIDAALEALPNIGTGGVTTAVGTATAGVGTFTVTFDGAVNRKRNLAAAMGVTSALEGTSPTVGVSRTTPGVDATYRSAVTGLAVVDITTGVLYVNTSTTQGAPTWTAQT